MEERVILPFMTAQEEEVYRRYYGEHNLPSSSQQHQPPETIRRPSYPPTRSAIPLDNQHYGEVSSEIVGTLNHAYVSTPNLDTLPHQRNTNIKLQPISPNPPSPLEPGFIKIPDHATLNTNPLEINPQKPELPASKTTFKERLMSKTRFASRGAKPSSMRQILRGLHIIPATLVLILVILVNQNFPTTLKNQTTMYYFYVPSCLDLFLTLFHTIDYYQRRFSYRSKLRRIIPMSLDIILSILWICGILPLAFQFNPCPIGTLNGFCDLRNSLLAFACMSGALNLMEFIWDLVGTCLCLKQKTNH